MFGAKVLPVLIQLSNDGVSNVRMQATVALQPLISNSEARDAVLSRLEDEVSDVRATAAGIIASILDDDSKLLLSRDLNGVGPWVDPGQLIEEWRIERIAARLDISPGDAMAKYKRLNEHLGGRLNLPPV